MATKTLAENITQAISDFDSIRIVVATLDSSVTSAPTSSYGDKIGTCFANQYTAGQTAGHTEGYAEGYSVGYAAGEGEINAQIAPLNDTLESRLGGGQ